MANKPINLALYAYTFNNNHAIDKAHEIEYNAGRRVLCVLVPDIVVEVLRSLNEIDDVERRDGKSRMYSTDWGQLALYDIGVFEDGKLTFYMVSRL